MKSIERSFFENENSGNGAKCDPLYVNLWLKTKIHNQNFNFMLAFSSITFVYNNSDETTIQ